MVELLQKGKVRAAQTNEILLKIIANPIEKYLPDGSKRIGLSVNGERVTMREYVERLTGKKVKDAETVWAKQGKKEEKKSESSDSTEKTEQDAAAATAKANNETSLNVTGEEKFIPPVFVIGGVAHCDPVSEEKFGANYIEEKISISPYGLSASCVCSKICNEFENVWGI